VVWCIEYTQAKIGGIFGNTTQACTVDYFEATLENTHFMTDPIITDGSDLGEASGMLSIRVFRNATDDRDTYPQEAYLLEYDIHYYVDKLGLTTTY
jgi:hypothetical protein